MPSRSTRRRSRCDALDLCGTVLCCATGMFSCGSCDWPDTILKLASACAIGGDPTRYSRSLLPWLADAGRDFGGVPG